MFMSNTQVIDLQPLAIDHEDFIPCYEVLDCDVDESINSFMKAVDLLRGIRDKDRESVIAENGFIWVYMLINNAYMPMFFCKESKENLQKFRDHNLYVA